VKKAEQLQLMAQKLRIDSLKSTTEAGSGHPTSCMSAAEIVSALFFSELQEDDEFILSKGHAAPILWAVYAEAGCIPEEDLSTLRRIDSVLEGHPTFRMPLIRVATGSLGQGLSAAVGMALGKRLKKSKGRVYVLLGDGECAEGSVWEAANSAVYYGLANICAIIDVNRLGQSGPTMHGHDVSPYVAKFKAFGWNTAVIDGHNVNDILNGFDKARAGRRPFAVVAKTSKGKGVSFLEDGEGWHGRPLSRDELRKALEEIGDARIHLTSNLKCKRKADYEFVDYEVRRFTLGEMVATRSAFGDSLIDIADANAHIVVIDGDVKNSTMTEDFFRVHSERAFQSFIAEQNMVGMAIGLSAMGFSPFVATFSTFLTRAHDFIRMAQYSMANIKFVGSHAGISIGPDGPSQMGLEDIPMFLSMPKTVVLYPSDAVSTAHLMKEMAKHNGIAYLRTTREKTPVIYSNADAFPIGGFKVLRKTDKDSALVISLGVTLHEALRAHEILKKKGIDVRVIDLYSLQPLDFSSLAENSRECGGNVITVEDHYCNALGSLLSGVSEKVTYLCVRDIPQSGAPEELRRKYGIDSTAIVRMVEQFR